MVIMSIDYMGLRLLRAPCLGVYGTGRLVLTQARFFTRVATDARSEGVFPFKSSPISGLVFPVKFLPQFLEWRCSISYDPHNEQR
jgi:hypothetical protein